MNSIPEKKNTGFCLLPRDHIRHIDKKRGKRLKRGKKKGEYGRRKKKKERGGEEEEEE